MQISSQILGQNLIHHWIIREIPLPLPLVECSVFNLISKEQVITTTRGRVLERVG